MLTESLGYAMATTLVLFPGAKSGAKLREEAAELQAALDSGDEAAIVDEMADCFICLAHAIGLRQQRFCALADAIIAKCDLLMTRKWAFNEETQTYHHIKETDQ